MKYKILIITSLVFLTSCASNKTFRPSSDSVCPYTKKGECNVNAIQLANSNTQRKYHLSFIEYDDQGQLRSPKQKNNVIKHYKKLAEDKDILLITFVHGWHHSAKVNDPNIESFRELLEQSAELELKKGGSGREVLGLYIGWRGSSLDIKVPFTKTKVPLLKYGEILTFWDRKNTAQEIGQIGVSSTLLELESLIKANKTANNKMITIGHSFGAAVVFSSLQSIFAERFIEGRPFGETTVANGFGDLVVLLNPAFEALRFGPLYDLSQESCLEYPDEQLPKLVILTSECDLATRWAFPAGRVFSTIFETHNNITRNFCTSKHVGVHLTKEAYVDIIAVGHAKPYMTHMLKKEAGAKSELHNKHVNTLPDTWSKSSNLGIAKFKGVVLESLDRTKPRNPYLNVQVSKNIIGNHNDIWRDEIKYFIRDLISLSSSSKKKN